jgi:phage protein D
LAKRWFDLREKLGRWATIEVEGHPDLVPYNAVVVDGDMAKMDKGYWLPTVVEHNFSESGWTTRLTCIRVVEDSTITEAS